MVSPHPIFSCVALYSVYNEEDLLDHSLLSISPYVSRVVVADGPWDTWPEETLGSTDKTPLILRKWKSIYGEWFSIIVHDNLPEKTTRNSLFHSIAPHEVGLVVDGDEILFGDVPLGLERFINNNRWHFGMVNVLQARGALDPRPRLFKPTGWKWKTWFELEDEDGCFVDLKQSDHWDHLIITNFRIVNLHVMFRSKEREEKGIAAKEAAMKRGWS